MHRNEFAFEKKYCCGCGLCSTNVNGEINEKGYYRPADDNLKQQFDTDVCYCNQLQNIVDNNLWGDIKQAYYGYSSDEKVRTMASSGGILTEIACYLVKKKIVDFIIQIGVNPENQLQTRTVYNNDVESIRKCCGSRYTASASLYNLLDNIEPEKKYAIIGKPCDIRVLQEYMKKHPNLQKNFLYLLSFFCGGTPSKQANEKLLNKMNVNVDELKEFTYRGNGWPGLTKAVTTDDRVSVTQYEESWGNILGRDLQEICRFCWDGIGEAADISCGDGWYLENGKPSFEEKEGRNVILVRSEMGNELLRKMCEEKVIVLNEVEDLSILNEMQPGHFMRKSAMFAMTVAMKIMNKRVPKYNMGKLLKFSRNLTLMQNIRMFGGVVKRIKNGKIE